ncbi:MAG: AAA family ATPase [Kiritimatiellia bacterium]
MNADNAAAWKNVQEQIARLKREMATVIVGQEEIVELMLVALLCRGHCLIVGVPGLAKTLLVSTLGHILGLSFHRIQFTPDLMPMDILGSEILQDAGGGKREFEFSPGPIFAHLILADEINRTPPKTQAALLEAMQERQVTISGKTVALPDPFVVYATQNPIEHEGTYPLPEAQLDRFFFNLKIDYPSVAQEIEIVNRTTARLGEPPAVLLDADRIRQLQASIYDVPIPDHVVAGIVNLAHRTRPSDPLGDEYVRNYVEWGAGPRAAQYLTLAAKALAVLRGNPAASEEEVRAVARPILRHRVIPNYNATGDGIDVEAILDHLLEKK